MTDQNLTHLSLIVDRSGSMQAIRSDMEGGIAAFLADQARRPGAVTVDVTTFDTLVAHPYTNARIGDVRGPFIVPRGATALLDAMGSSIVGLGDRLATTPEERRPGTVIVLTVTDGLENSSREFTPRAVRRLVTQQQRVYSWQFVFLGANIDSFDVAGGLGIARDSTINYSPSAEGVAGVFSATSAYVSRLRSARAAGSPAPAGFTSAERARATGARKSGGQPIADPHAQSSDAGHGANEPRR